MLKETDLKEFLKSASITLSDGTVASRISQAKAKDTRNWRCTTVAPPARSARTHWTYRTCVYGYSEFDTVVGRKRGHAYGDASAQPTVTPATPAVWGL